MSYLRIEHKQLGGACRRAQGTLNVATPAAVATKKHELLSAAALPEGRVCRLAVQKKCCMTQQTLAGTCRARTLWAISRHKQQGGRREQGCACTRRKGACSCIAFLYGHTSIWRCWKKGYLSIKTRWQTKGSFGDGWIICKCCWPCVTGSRSIERAQR